MFNIIPRRVMYLYCWYRLNALQHKYDICHIVKQGSEVSCTKGRTGALCCSGCKYLGPNGCTTKNLACKLWFCDEILADKNTNTKYKSYFEEAKIINDIIDMYKLPLTYRTDYRLLFK